ncbi:MAG: plasmid replication protein, CyRepA1 family [Acinetobacter sp.]
MSNYDGLSNEQIRSALSFLDYEDRDEWLMAGMCIKHELGELGFDMWNSWSSLSSSYNAKHNKSQWKSFKAHKGRTIGTFMYHAINAGFKFDEKIQRVSPHIIQQRQERQKQLEVEAVIEEKKTIEQQAKSANKAQYLFSKATETESHEYLAKKDVMAHGLKVGEWTYKDDSGELQVEKNALLVPLSFDDEIVSLQGIFPCGTKKLLFGAKKQGVHFIFGECTSTILICEGWATGATLHEATQLMTFVAIDAGNLEHVAKYVRRKYPLSRIILCADNDQYGKSNAGIKSANKAACSVDADVVYPIFSDLSNQPTDFNDLYHESGYNAVFERVMSAQLYLAKENDSEVFDAFQLPYIENAERILEESQAPLNVARAALVVAMRMSDKVPAFTTIEQIRKFIDHPLLNPRTHTSIMCRVQWSVQNRKRMALTAVKPQSWGNKHDHVVLSSLSEFKITNPVSLVFAPMGSGKTKDVIKPFCDSSEKPFCAIAHRRSLIADLAKRLSIASYEDEGSQYQDKVAVCLPSIDSGQMQTFIGRATNIAIDEISQNIRFTKSKECKVSGRTEENVFFGLKKLVNEAEKVIAADASIDQTTIDFFEQARPDERFTIVELLPDNRRQRKCFLYFDRADLLTKIDIELQNGGNVWLSIESAERAEVLKQIFEKRYETLAITSKNSKRKEIREFLDNIEEYSRNYRLIIASPAISSGVSVEHRDGKHFTMIAGMASGHKICFSDFAQMLARVRYVDHYHVFLQPNNKRFEHVNAISILTGLRQAAMLEGATIKENEYSAFKAHIEATEEMYRADFANGFCWFLEYYCFEILSGFVASADHHLSEQMKELTKEMKAKHRHSIKAADAITKETAFVIENKLDQTDEEYFQLVAYKVRSSLGFPLDHDISETDIDMFENMPVVDRFARLLGFSFESDESDKNIALRRFQCAQIRASEIIFNKMELGSTIFDKSLCDEIMRRVTDNSNRFMLSSLKLIPSKYGAWRESKKGELLQMNLPENKTRAVGQILEKFGLSLRRTSKTGGENVYKITDDSLSLMTEYATRRYSNFMQFR